MDSMNPWLERKARTMNQVHKPEHFDQSENIGGTVQLQRISGIDTDGSIYCELSDRDHWLHARFSGDLIEQFDAERNSNSPFLSLRNDLFSIQSFTWSFNTPLTTIPSGPSHYLPARLIIQVVAFRYLGEGGIPFHKNGIRPKLLTELPELREWEKEIKEVIIERRKEGLLTPLKNFENLIGQTYEVAQESMELGNEETRLALLARRSLSAPLMNIESSADKKGKGREKEEEEEEEEEKKEDKKVTSNGRSNAVKRGGNQWRNETSDDDDDDDDDTELILSKTTCTSATSNSKASTSTLAIPIPTKSTSTSTSNSSISPTQSRKPPARTTVSASRSKKVSINSKNQFQFDSDSSGDEEMKKALGFKAQIMKVTTSTTTNSKPSTSTLSDNSTSVSAVPVVSVIEEIVPRPKGGNQWVEDKSSSDEDELGVNKVLPVPSIVSNPLPQSKSTSETTKKLNNSLSNKNKRGITFDGSATSYDVVGGNKRLKPNDIKTPTTTSKSLKLTIISSSPPANSSPSQRVSSHFSYNLFHRSQNTIYQTQTPIKPPTAAQRPLSPPSPNHDSQASSIFSSSPLTDSKIPEFIATCDLVGVSQITGQPSGRQRRFDQSIEREEKEADDDDDDDDDDEEDSKSEGINIDIWGDEQERENDEEEEDQDVVMRDGIEMDSDEMEEISDEDEGEDADAEKGYDLYGEAEKRRREMEDEDEDQEVRSFLSSPPKSSVPISTMTIRKTGGLSRKTPSGSDLDTNASGSLPSPISNAPITRTRSQESNTSSKPSATNPISHLKYTFPVPPSLPLNSTSTSPPIDPIHSILTSTSNPDNTSTTIQSELIFEELGEEAFELLEKELQASKLVARENARKAEMERRAIKRETEEMLERNRKGEEIKMEVDEKEVSGTELINSLEVIKKERQEMESKEVEKERKKREELKKQKESDEMKIRSRLPLNIHSFETWLASLNETNSI